VASAMRSFAVICVDRALQSGLLNMDPVALLKRWSTKVVFHGSDERRELCGKRKARQRLPVPIISIAFLSLMFPTP